jgi:hypothetical protein
MSKPSAKRRQTSGRRPKAPTSDRTIYFGFVVICGFAVLLVALLTNGEYWKHALIASGVFLAFLVHRHAFDVYFGRAGRLAGWQRAMARLLLQCVGYGSGPHGKPLEAAHDDPKVLRAIITGLVLSVVILGGCGAWLLL